MDLADQRVDEPERLVLRPSKRKWALVLVACIVFVAAGLLMISDGRLWGWFVTIVFGLGVPLSLVALFGSRLNVVLTPDAFTFGTLWRTRTIRWSDVDSFEGQSMGRSGLVRFETTSSSGQKGGYLPANGINAEKLAEKMDTWKRKLAP